MCLIVGRGLSSYMGQLITDEMLDFKLYLHWRQLFRPSEGLSSLVMQLMRQNQKVDRAVPSRSKTLLHWHSQSKQPTSKQTLVTQNLSFLNGKVVVCRELSKLRKPRCPWECTWDLAILWKKTDGVRKRTRLIGCMAMTRRRSSNNCS